MYKMLQRPFMRAKAAENRSEQSDLEPAFWQHKALEDLSKAEWEALCDGCGQCCLLKLECDPEEDAEETETGPVYYTTIACRLFDDATCRCGAYAERQQLVSQCIVLTPEVVRQSCDWMPESCAYRRLAEGRALAWWHPLVSGDPQTVHQAGISVKGQTTPEYDVAEDEYWDYLQSETPINSPIKPE